MGYKIVITTAVSSVLLFAGLLTKSHAEKIFSSGFEAGTYTTMDKTEQRAKDIRGYDSTTGYDWVEDLEADGREHKMNYCDGTDGVNPSMLGAYIDEDPDDPENKVFYTWQYDAEEHSDGYWTRVQTRMNNCRFAEAYLKMRVRFGSDMAVVNNKDWWIWCSLFSINPLNDNGYSLSVRLVRDTVLKWGMYRKNKVEGPTHYVTQKKVNFETWHTMEFYAKAGDENNGRFWLAVDGERIIDEQARTSDAGDVWENMRFFKLYGEIVDVVTDPDKGNRECVKVWWDDFELWDSEPMPTEMKIQPVKESHTVIKLPNRARQQEIRQYMLNGRAIGNIQIGNSNGILSLKSASSAAAGIYLIKTFDKTKRETVSATPERKE